jgi:hypothetical protein
MFVINDTASAESNFLYKTFHIKQADKWIIRLFHKEISGILIG